MERALRLLLAWGFAERDLHTVLWLARRGNWASRRLAWRLGFSVEGTLRDWLPQRGVLVDAWVGTLRRGEPMSPRAGWLLAPRIVGDSVVLRANMEADIPGLVEGINDPEVRRYSRTLRELAPHDEAKARERVLGHLEEAARGGSMTWTVADVGTDQLLGWVALFGMTHGLDAEVGYWVHPNARGRGVAGEACRLAVRHAFVDTEDGGLGLHRIKAYAAMENAASCRVLEQAGFTRFGIERGSTQLPDGTYVDTAAYDLLSTDLPRRTALQDG